MKGSLRRLRDNQLEEPYRSWINREVTLPTDVNVLPRKIDVHGETTVLITVGSGCLAMAILVFPLALITIDSDTSKDALLVVALIAIAIVLLPSWMIWRLCVTFSARRDQRCGKLRQGIIIGTAGIVVRLSPNRCFVIPLERFLLARPWGGGGD